VASHSADETRDGIVQEKLIEFHSEKLAAVMKLSVTNTNGKRGGALFLPPADFLPRLRLGCENRINAFRRQTRASPLRRHLELRREGGPEVGWRA
jgi:hypothetical protein